MIKQAKEKVYQQTYLSQYKQSHLNFSGDQHKGACRYHLQPSATLRKGAEVGDGAGMMQRAYVGKKEQHKKWKAEESTSEVDNNDESLMRPVWEDNLIITRTCSVFFGNEHLIQSEVIQFLLSITVNYDNSYAASKTVVVVTEYHSL